ncbi:putative ribose-5-phosphate ketol-isomerase [Tirmania nivea]|nr:putative ribose-5-phosphate ketol-isomerase [Tirmania nivea]
MQGGTHLRNKFSGGMHKCINKLLSLPIPQISSSYPTFTRNCTRIGFNSTSIIRQHKPFHHQYRYLTTFNPHHFKMVTSPTPVSLSSVESAKRQAAHLAVDAHFPRSISPPSSPILIGIGSGSTVIYVVERILQLPHSLLSQCIFIPTGYQSRQLILSGSLTLGDIDSHNHLHVAFDGADEVDPALNCIKGGGACLFQEKLVAIKAEKFVVVADFRKISSSLSTAYAPGVPIEVVPQAVSWVTKRLVELGSVNPTLRMGGRAKAGPCVTDNGNFIIDAPFRDGCVVGKEGEVNGGVKGSGIGDTGNVERLAEEIKRIVGVVEHGIFCRGNAKAVMAYFGMEHGDVTTRTEVV